MEAKYEFEKDKDLRRKSKKKRIKKREEKAKE